jgi:hypothetical protein
MPLLRLAVHAEVRTSVKRDLIYRQRDLLLLAYLNNDTDRGAAAVDRVGAEIGRGGEGKGEGEEVLWLVWRKYIWSSVNAASSSSSSSSSDGQT